MAYTYRVLPGPAVTGPGTVNGRTYSNSNGYVDVPSFEDARQLEGNGWMIVGRVGSTAQRPGFGVTEPSPAYRLTHYIDTTLGKAIVSDGSQWRDPVTGAVV